MILCGNSFYITKEQSTICFKLFKDGVKLGFTLANPYVYLVN